MHEQSQGDSLLVCARRALIEEILPSVSAEKKHALLMAVNAISIVERQSRYGEEAAAAELNAFRRLTDDPDADLLSAGRNLVSMIRDGGADPQSPARTLIYQSLRESVLNRLKQSNPKALPTSEKPVI